MPDGRFRRRPSPPWRAPCRRTRPPRRSCCRWCRTISSFPDTRARRRTPASPMCDDVKRDRNARAGVVERLHDVAGQPLEAIDVAPRRLPGSEIGREFVGRRGQRLREAARPARCVDVSSIDTPPRPPLGSSAAGHLRPRTRRATSAPKSAAQRRSHLRSIAICSASFAFSGFDAGASSQALISAGIGFSNHGR